MHFYGWKKNYYVQHICLKSKVFWFALTIHYDCDNLDTSVGGFFKKIILIG